MRGRRDAWGLAGWIGVTGLAAVIGSFASSSAPAVYGSLAKPDWAPPAWLFGPVWTVLYLVISIAAWLVWREGLGTPRADVAAARRPALWLYGIQLALNVLWSWLFFGWRMGGVSLIEIVVLWILIATTMIAFWRVSRLASILMVPYLAWVTFASALNAAIWSFNRGQI